jgi:hypothetical protein
VCLTACSPPATSGDASGDVTQFGDASDTFDAAPHDVQDEPLGDAADAPAPPLDDLARLRALVAALPTAPDDAARTTLVTDFMHTVEYGTRGFPIRVGNDYAFAFWDPDRMPGAVTVAGDYDAWTQEPMLQPVTSVPFYYRIDTITPPAARSLYKFVRSATSFFADPAARRFGYDGNGEFSLLEPGTDLSHLERWPGFSDHAGALSPREVLVYVPAHLSATPLPVLYMHDGQNLFDPAAIWGGWHVSDAADAAIASGDVQPFLVVGVPNSPARMDEYTHTTDSLNSGDPPVGGRADEYVTFVVDGIKPFIDARYPTRSDAAHTGILGSSLGGLVSIYFAHQRPSVFGYAGSMSGTFGWGSFWGSYNRTVMHVWETNPPTGQNYYLDSGGGDGGTPGCVDLDGDGVHDDNPNAAGENTDNYCETLDMEATLRSHGAVDGTTLFTSFVPGAMHNEASWASRFPNAIRTWFPAHR